MKRGGPVKRTDGGEQPEALVVKGVEIQGLQCLQLKQHEKKNIWMSLLFFQHLSIMSLLTIFQASRWCTDGAAKLGWEALICLNVTLFLLGQAILSRHGQARRSSHSVRCRHRDAWAPTCLNLKIFHRLAWKTKPLPSSFCSGKEGSAWTPISWWILGKSPMVLSCNLDQNHPSMTPMTSRYETDSLDASRILETVLLWISQQSNKVLLTCCVVAPVQVSEVPWDAISRRWLHQWHFPLSQAESLRTSSHFATSNSLT